MAKQNTADQHAGGKPVDKAEKTQKTPEVQGETKQANGDKPVEGKKESLPDTGWEVQDKHLHYDFNGHLHIHREVLAKVPIEDLARLMKGVFDRVKREGGLNTDTLFFQNGKLRLVVKDSNSREELYGDDIGRSGQWHRNNKHHTEITIEEVY